MLLILTGVYINMLSYPPKYVCQDYTNFLHLFSFLMYIDLCIFQGHSNIFSSAIRLDV